LDNAHQGELDIGSYRVEFEATFAQRDHMRLVTVSR
jgi:hypothetical protein